MQRFFALPWVRVILTHAGILAALAAILAVLSWLFGSACPTYAIFGICCPFCGMTRAHLAALRLDFATAISYHPVFFTGVPFLWIIFHEHFFNKTWQRVLWWILMALLITLLLGTYVARVIIAGSFNFIA